MAGLNIRLNKEGTRLFFQNREKYIANINLDENNYTVDRVYSIFELDSLVKFEADVLGSDIVALGSQGTLKVSSKNLCYKLSTEKGQKFSTFNCSPDNKWMVAAGTTRDENTKIHTSTLYSWRSQKSGVLKKGSDLKVITKWENEGYDVLIDVAITFSAEEPGSYMVGTATLHTGLFFLLSMRRGEFEVYNKMELRERGLQTFLLKYEGTKFWAAGDDCCINVIEAGEEDKEKGQENQA